MSTVRSLIETIIEPLVENPEDIQLDLNETAEFNEYRLTLHPDDVGRVIGRRGRVARAIRTIVYSAKTDNGKRTRLIIGEDEA